MRIPRFGEKSHPGVVLRGKRVTLRALRANDFEQWSAVRVRCGEWLTKWEPQSPPQTPDVTQNRQAFDYRCMSRDREWQLGVGYGFGVFIDDGERFVGELNINGVARGPLQMAHAGYWIDRDVAGQSIMPEAVVVMLRFAFEDLGLHRMEISIIPRNSSSRRVVEKLGLREEGTSLRYLEINGVWEDHVHYAITVEEWQERRAEFTERWLSRP